MECTGARPRPGILAGPLDNKSRLNCWPGMAAAFGHAPEQYYPSSRLECVFVWMDGGGCRRLSFPACCYHVDRILQAKWA